MREWRITVQLVNHKGVSTWSDSREPFATDSYTDAVERAEQSIRRENIPVSVDDSVAAEAHLYERDPLNVDKWMFICTRYNVFRENQW